MQPCLVRLAALMALGNSATAKVYSLADTYKVTNFFDKFDFFESKFGTDDNSNVDPTNGYVNYKNRSTAFATGLVRELESDVYVGVDHTNARWGVIGGRPSVRLESKADYYRGLVVARFSHLPKTVCGSWPAFWSYGKAVGWPKGGEIDIYEGWNLNPENRPTFHTGETSDVGECILDLDGTGLVLEDSCSPSKGNTGCSVADKTGPWALEEGGIYALEWTKNYIKIFTFHHKDAPADIDSQHPDTSTWEEPVAFLKGDSCSIDRHFAAQKLILNITFCGDAAGNAALWEQCQKKTGVGLCAAYVKRNPRAFKDIYFKVQDIRYFVVSAVPKT